MTRASYSWGLYPKKPQVVHSCSWESDLPAVKRLLSDKYKSFLPFGNGRSYGDSCLAESSHVLSIRNMDRFIYFDWQRGIVRAEAGVSLAEILAITIPQGWFLSVTPGTQYATLGGAIANDVHGKNHHLRGTFGRHVVSFGLLRNGGEIVVCSPLQQTDLYAATIGGLGLTGVIVWAEIQLIKIVTAEIDTTVVRFNNLSEFFLLSAELDSKHEYSVAWIDCLAKGSEVGRGVYIVGDHSRYGRAEILSSSKVGVPIAPPFSLVNNMSLKVFNNLYWHCHPSNSTRSRTSYEPFFYPLDRISNWNRIYGRKGFQQYQCVIPEASAEIAMMALLDCISASGQGSFLAVLKRCGNIESPGLISFPMPGISLALDFPQTADLDSLFIRMDDIVREAAGRLYPAKDAHMSGSDFRAAYPAWEQLEKIRDPSIMSLFWKRVIL